MKTDELMLICPECKSDYVNLLALGPYNPYMYGCGDCFHKWNDVSEELEEIELRFATTPTPAPNDSGGNG